MFQNMEVWPLELEKELKWWVSGAKKMAEKGNGNTEMAYLFMLSL